MNKIKSPKEPQELEVETENNLELIECNRELVILYSQEKLLMLFMSFSIKHKLSKTFTKFLFGKLMSQFLNQNTMLFAWFLKEVSFLHY
jgi:hypothetical protein